MKAFFVNNGNGNDVIVFAENRNKAKQKAMKCEDFEDYSYLQIKAHRYKDADDINHYKDVIDGTSKKDQEFLRQLGFQCGEDEYDSGTYCDYCGLYEFDLIENSHIEELEDENICQGCLKELKQTEIEK